MKKLLLTGSVLAMLAFALAGSATARLGASEDQPTDEAIVKSQMPAYPFRVCVVDGTKFSDEKKAIPFVKFGRLLLVCSDECSKKVDTDPAETYILQLNEAIIGLQKQIYPLTTCVVSGEELGSMGEPIDAVHGTRLVRLCCKSCRKGLSKEPDKYIAKIDEALIEKLRATYPLDKCVISGHDLDPKEAVDKLYGVTLVRLCCKDCIEEYDKDPRALAMKVQDAERALRKEKAGDEKAKEDKKG